MPTTVQDVIASGTAAARPAASSSNTGYLYFATDTAGGTLYRSTGAAWVAVAPGVAAAGFANPMTTAGDIITGGVAGAAGRLGVGSAGQVLTVTGGVPAWATPASGAAAFSGAKVGRSATQLINANTNTDVNWDNESYDVGGYHDNAANNERLTIPAGKGGYQLITVLIYINGTSGNALNAWLRLNNTTDMDGIQATFMVSTDYMIQYNAVLNMAAGDYVTLRIRCSSTSGTVARTALAWPLFTIALIGT